MPNDTTILDAAGLNTATSTTSVAPAAAPAATPPVDQTTALLTQMAAMLAQLNAKMSAPAPVAAATVAATPAAPAPAPKPPIHPLFGRCCRYGDGIGFVTKVYSEEDLTDPTMRNGFGPNRNRLADPELGEMVDLIAFDANGTAKPVKSVHIDERDWAE